MCVCVCACVEIFLSTNDIKENQLKQLFKFSKSSRRYNILNIPNLLCQKMYKQRDILP